MDVAGVTAEQAGLASDFLLIPLLERVRGLTYLRLSAAIMLLLYPAFLLLSQLGLKLVMLGTLGLLNAGWYAILKGQLYNTLPGRSGTVLAVNNVGGLVGSVIPLGLGIVAQQAGLRVTMWLLLTGIPRSKTRSGEDIIT